MDLDAARKGWKQSERWVTEQLQGKWWENQGYPTMSFSNNQIMLPEEGHLPKDQCGDMGNGFSYASTPGAKTILESN